jgi:hypothetical protein
MSEDIKFKITADESGAVNAFKRVRNEVLNNEHGLKKVGQQGKITSTALKDAANVLGPEFQMLGDRIDHITGALGDVNGASLMAKASLITLVAVGGFEVGRMIGDWISGTQRWIEELKEAEAVSAKMQSRVLANTQERAGGMSPDQLQQELRGTSDAIQRIQEQIKESDMALMNFSGGNWVPFFGGGEQVRRESVESLKTQLEAQRQLHQTYQKAVADQAKAAREEESKREQAVVEQEAKAIETKKADNDKLVQSQNDYIANLDLELLKLKEGEEAYERKRLAMLGYSDTTIEKALQIKAAIEQETQLWRESEGRDSSVRIGQRGVIQGDQQRFITRGIGMKGDEKLLAAAKEQAKKAAELVAESKKQTRLLETRLPKEVIA